MVYELRDKDEWNDDNPAGTGNSKLRPTAWVEILNDY